MNKKGNRREYYFTSDLHLSHRNIIKYSNRPFANAAEMNEVLIKNWNSVVSPDDIIYILGDVAFEKDIEKLDWYLSRLQGEKHIVWGNHDTLLQNNIPLRKKHFKTTHDLVRIFVPPESNNDKGQGITLCHYAMRTWPSSHWGEFALHGHSHGTLLDDPNLLSVDVGVDCWNYTPVSMKQINEVMSKKTFKPIDHPVNSRE
jgi:calcineurin-like phosphoesterase family protein